jgi:hypothetical protein
MRLFGGGVLGLAVEDDAVLAAEVVSSGQGTTLRRAAELACPAGDDPVAAGKDLRRVLSQHGFAARTAAIGVPARWILTREAVFPAADADAVAGMARIEAERAFAAGLDPWIVDYREGPVADQRVPVLICAVDRRKAEFAHLMARAAGLKPRFMAPTGLLIASAAVPDAPSTLLLLLRPGGAEAVLREEGRVRALRHVPLPDGDPQAWAQALRDAVQRLTALTLGRAGADGPPLMVCDARPRTADGAPAPEGTALDLASLGITADDALESGNRFAPAAALALVAAGGETPPIDFLRPRFAAEAKPLAGRRLAWAAAVAAAALAAGGSYAVGWHRDARELAALQGRLAAMKPDIEAAREVVQRVTLARGWTDRRTRTLDPLKELALAFPVESRAWLTSLALRDDRRIVVTGKSADERTALAVLDRIRNRPAFAGARLLYLRDSGNASSEVAFSITFDYVNRE